MSQKKEKKVRKVAARLITEGVFNEFSIREISYKKRIDELLNQRKYLLIIIGAIMIAFAVEIIIR